MPVAAPKVEEKKSGCCGCSCCFHIWLWILVAAVLLGIGIYLYIGDKSDTKNKKITDKADLEGARLLRVRHEAERNLAKAKSDKAAKEKIAQFEREQAEAVRKQNEHLQKEKARLERETADKARRLREAADKLREAADKARRERETAPKREAPTQKPDPKTIGNGKELIKAAVLVNQGKKQIANEDWHRHMSKRRGYLPRANTGKSTIDKKYYWRSKRGQPKEVIPYYRNGVRVYRRRLFPDLSSLTDLFTFKTEEESAADKAHREREEKLNNELWHSHMYKNPGYNPISNMGRSTLDGKWYKRDGPGQPKKVIPPPSKHYWSPGPGQPDQLIPYFRHDSGTGKSVRVHRRRR